VTRQPTTTILIGDCRKTLKTLPDKSVHCVVTSPPYWGLRDYGHPDQIGQEETPEEFVENLVGVFGELRRVLRDNGTCWLNLGDSYAGPSTHSTKYNLCSKGLVGIPWRVAFALQQWAWIIRQEIIWSKPDPMPSSVKDRCTTSHEHIFLLTKQERYFWNRAAMTEPAAYAGKPRGGSKRRYEQNAAGMDCKIYNTRNKRTVWTVRPERTGDGHFAKFPPELITPCVLAGTPEGGTVLDPFGGAGTTGLVALQHGRNSILCELNAEYAEIARKRLVKADPMFSRVHVQEGGQ
jgi:DNA modification methylase